MTKSAELMRSVLAAAQRFDSPDDALQDRVWAAVEQRVDAGDPGLSLSDGSSAAIGSGSAGWLTPLKVLAVVGIVGLAAGAIALSRGESEPEIAAAPAAVEAPEPEPTAPKEEAPPPAAVVVAPEVVAAPVDVPDKPEPSTRARKPQRGAAELDATDSLGAEVELLRRARAAANAGNHRGALTILQDHQRRFPRGKLARERDMSRLRALCALGRQADAKKLASSMLARDGSGVLRAKLEKTCAGSLP